MLSELRQLAAAGDIDIKTAMRLMLSAQADLMSHLKIGRDERDELKRAVEDLTEQVEDVGADVKQIHAEMVKMKKNPLVRAGDLMLESPKLAWFIGIVVFLAANLWFISGFRQAILAALGVPPEIVDILAPQ